MLGLTYHENNVKEMSICRIEQDRKAWHLAGVRLAHRREIPIEHVKATGLSEKIIECFKNSHETLSCIVRRSAV